MEFPQIDEIVVPQLESKEVTDVNETAVKFGFIGAGQAGGKLAQQFYKLGYRRILAVNTTTQDFEGLEFPSKLVIGSGTFGAGKNPEIGQKAAHESREAVLRECRKAFGTEVEHIMVLASSGGGTGSGATEVLVEIAGDYLVSLGKPRKVGVIVSLPKKAEGAQVDQNSKRLMGKLSAFVDTKIVAPLVVADNEKILKLYPNVSVARFYDVVNQNIASLFNAFNELSAKNSKFQTLDRADYRTVLDSGVIVFGMTVIPNPQSETALAEAVEKNTKAGFLADVSIQGASHLGAIMVATENTLENIPQSSFDMAFQTMIRSIGSENLLMHSGIYVGPENLGPRAVIYTMCGVPRLEK